MGNICSSKPKKGTGKKNFVPSKMNVTNLKERYDIDPKTLGSGSFGKVFKATDRNDKSINIAIKVINKNGMSDDDLLALRNEI